MTCRDCKGSGRCADCGGTGQGDPHAVAYCEVCNGSGVCQECRVVKNPFADFDTDNASVDDSRVRSDVMHMLVDLLEIRVLEKVRQGDGERTEDFLCDLQRALMRWDDRIPTPKQAAWVCRVHAFHVDRTGLGAVLLRDLQAAGKIERPAVSMSGRRGRP